MAIRSYSEKATYCRVAFAAGAGKATCMQGLQKKLAARPQGKVTWVHSPPLGATWLDLPYDGLKAVGVPVSLQFLTRRVLSTPPPPLFADRAC